MLFCGVWGFFRSVPPRIGPRPRSGRKLTSANRLTPCVEAAWPWGSMISTSVRQCKGGTWDCRGFGHDECPQCLIGREHLLGVYAEDVSPVQGVRASPFFWWGPCHVSCPWFLMNANVFSLKGWVFPFRVRAHMTSSEERRVLYSPLRVARHRGARGALRG